MARSTHSLPLVLASLVRGQHGGRHEGSVSVWVCRIADAIVKVVCFSRCSNSTLLRAIKQPCSYLILASAVTPADCVCCRQRRLPLRVWTNGP
jgi:hypothetical protein